MGEKGNILDLVPLLLFMLLMVGISIYIRKNWMMEQQIGELKKQINHIINKDV